MTLALFEDRTSSPIVDAIGEQAHVLRGFAFDAANELFDAIARIDQQSPFRHMQTPGGFTMSVALTNCGRLGWTTDRRGYRYTELDPLTGNPWPAMPTVLERLARAAAAETGFPGYVPDACLVNRYSPGSRLTLHQDKNERTFDKPIVSISLGIPATFLFGGHKRTDPVARIPLRHGDVVVWGGVDRLRFHGVHPLKDAMHPEAGAHRFNLTLRRAG